MTSYNFAYKNDGTKVTEITTDKNGYAVSNPVLSYGSYYIQEIKPSKGYYINNERINFESKAKDLVNASTSKEKVIKNYISILKQYNYVNGNTTFLNAESGITFDIYYPNGDKYTSITTDKNGYATLNMPYGIWEFHQVNTTTGYEKIYDFFIITKENYQVYYLFEKLINDIKNINIYNRDDYYFPPYIETEEEKKEYLEELELDKERYRKFNMSHYNDLFDEYNNIITWVSDETGFEVANKLQLKKLNDKILIEFSTQPYIEGYEKENNFFGMIGIRFRNSGSRYAPFNYIFMRMFTELQLVDDIEDYAHQIHIEEYLYEKEKVKKLSLNKKQ